MCNGQKERKLCEIATQNDKKQSQESRFEYERECTYDLKQALAAASQVEKKAVCYYVFVTTKTCRPSSLSCVVSTASQPRYFRMEA